MNRFLIPGALRNCDVFGDPIEDAAEVAPCRTIAITPEVLAEDAAKQASRRTFTIPEKAPSPLIQGFKRYKTRPKIIRTCLWCKAEMPTGELDRHKPICPIAPRPFA